MSSFEVGKTYYTRCSTDADHVISITVASRTPNTIVTTEGKRFRIARHNQQDEFIRPWGRYSLAPTIWADRPLEKLVVGSFIRVLRGCKNLEIDPNAYAKVSNVAELEIPGGTVVRVELRLFSSGKQHILSAQSIPALNEPDIELTDDNGNQIVVTGISGVPPFTGSSR